MLSNVFQYTKGSWPRQIPQCLCPFSDWRNELTVEEGCLLWGFRVIIPHSLRHKLLKELHRDHPGVTRMKSVARSYMWWPGLDKELKQLAKSCQSCQAVKGAPPLAPLHPWIWPMAESSSRFCWPLPGSNVPGLCGRLFKVARSPSHVDHNRFEDLECFK